ncbi:MAG: glutamate cyclase domain-containing protein, partial [Candidatus Methylomirabilia bacterium]
LARRVASVVRVDHLVVAGISNWGAYGVTAHLSLLSGQSLLHTPDEDRRLVEACVEAGGVDGLTWRREATVDGVPAIAHAAVVELLRAVTRRAGGGFRS